MDSRQLAGLGSLRLHTVVAGADVHRGAGVLERGVHLSLRRRLWRNGPPLAGNDSSIRRPCALSAFPMAFHLCADFFGRRLRGFFRVEPDRNCARGLYLGVWHGMMQTYGFCRIYDAKVGSFAEVTRRLDFALCGIWFATAVLLSLGKVLMREGNVSQAIAQFEEALRLHPDFPEAEQNLRIAKGTSAQSP